MDRDTADTSTGLEDTVVAQTGLCEIDGEEGTLAIRGVPVEDVVGNGSFEEALYLLWNDELPNTSQLAEFSDALVGASPLPSSTIEVLRVLAENDVPVVDALGIGVATTARQRSGDGAGAEPTVVDESVAAVARVAMVTATYWRLASGEEPVQPEPSFSHAENYLYTLTGDVPAAGHADLLESYLIAAIEHGLNSSSFVGRVVASTGSDVGSAVVGAIEAFEGPLHGGAPEDVVDMLNEARGSDDVHAYVERRLDEGRRIPGFGHRVYRVRDPRAVILSESVEAFYAGSDDAAILEFARRFERAALEVLGERYPDADLCTNVEFYAAVLFDALSLPPALSTPTFAVSRVGGWTAHVQEQRRSNRLVRPRAAYVGPRDRTWTPLSRR